MEYAISVERALELLTESVGPVTSEQIPAIEAEGRILAADVIAPVSQPPWPRSPLDGYAFRAVDSAGASASNPVELRVVGAIYAGDAPRVTVGAGEAVRIATGAPIPSGCDCVIRQEDTDYAAGRDASRVNIFRELRPWDNYCRAGEDYRAGDVLLSAGTRLSGYAWGVLASAGLLRDDAVLSVRRKIRCALFAAGNELVSNAVRPLPPGKIYSSNEFTLSSRLRAFGVSAHCVPSGDDAAALADAIRQSAPDADLILTTGGVSVGERDILHETLSLLRAVAIFQQVRLKPGSPVRYSLFHGVPILSLSGNPFAAGATFELFARPLLATLAGCPDFLPLRFHAPLDAPFPKSGSVPRFVRGTLRDGRVILPDGHSSGQLRSAAETNCLARIPPHDGPFPAGKTVEIWLL